MKSPDFSARPKLVQVNEFADVGWEPTQGQNIVRLDGKIIHSEPTQLPGVVHFYNEKEKIEYHLTAILPLEELLNIARSIK